MFRLKHLFCIHKSRMEIFKFDVKLWGEPDWLYIRIVDDPCHDDLHLSRKDFNSLGTWVSFVRLFQFEMKLVKIPE